MHDHGIQPFDEPGTGAGLYTADQAAVMAMAIVTQVHAAATGLEGLAEHLLVLEEHGYADRR
ncbi:hypothetical protein ACIQ6K_38050 [Streptomyces sp. NPDC096354]|uniref:hypothetical protein n=1 Tax=Streptomyces sp. NPDC096354 TaxID=3366088 RepID=UPI0038201668